MKPRRHRAASRNQRQRVNTEIFTWANGANGEEKWKSARRREKNFDQRPMQRKQGNRILPKMMSFETLHYQERRRDLPRISQRTRIKDQEQEQPARRDGYSYEAQMELIGLCVFKTGEHSISGTGWMICSECWWSPRRYFKNLQHCP